MIWDGPTSSDAEVVSSSRSSSGVECGMAQPHRYDDGTSSTIVGSLGRFANTFLGLFTL